MRKTSIKDLLIKKSYRKYPQPVEYPYILKNLYEYRVSDERTSAVCETNKKLYIHIEEYQFKDSEIHYQINIRAERNSLWWDLKAYSLNADEVVKNIDVIEDDLIKMFNIISVSKENL